ncbi:sprT-like family protein [Prevotella sp. CAG:1185]|nr:sprT-like family protein [Prevotella sp. CAG:1185]
MKEQIHEKGIIPTEKDIFNRFYEYNSSFFQNKLPIPFFVIIHTRKTIGRFTCDYSENGDIKNPIIEISDRYEYTETQLKDIIIHEMLHYYLYYTHQNETQEHGKRWKQLAFFFNEKFGTNIQIKTDTNFIKETKNKKNWLLSNLFSK